MQDDQQLVQQIIAGDQAAFAQLIRRHQRLVGHIVFKLVRDAEDREELCQDVFIKVHQHLPGFKFESKLSTWIGRIAYHHALNFVKKKRAPVVLYEDMGGGYEEGENQPAIERIASQMGEGALDINAQPDIQLQQDDTATRLQQEIAQLPPVFRTILTLYHQQELSYKEIGDILNLPEGTVKSYLFRARAKLKTQLLKQYSQEELWK